MTGNASLSFMKRLLVPVAILALIIMTYSSDLFCVAIAAEEEWDVVNDSESSVDIENMKVTMSNGDIVIVARSKAASSGTRIRYQTIGFGVSESYQNNIVYTKGYSGPAATQNIGIIPITEDRKEDLGTDAQGYTTTRFTFKAEEVNREVGYKLRSITKGKKIYLNAIFQSYYLNDDGSKTIRKGKNGGITTWQEMMNAEEWGTDSLRGFEKYYNCEITFAPGKQHNYLYYDYPDSNPEYIRQLGDEYINATVKFANAVEKTSKSPSGKEYGLTGYYIKKRSGGEIAGARNIKGSEDYIYNTVIAASGKTKVPLGGLEVHIVYDKVIEVGTITNKLYYTYNGGKSKYVADVEGSVGDKISISDMHTKCETELSKTYDKYELIGFNITAIKAGTSLDGVTSMSVGVNGTTKNTILGTSVIVAKGGINIYLHYTDEFAAPTPKPTPPPYEYPEGGYENKPLSNFSNVGEIRADLRGQERFNVLQGIPTTESLYTQVRGTEYNLSYAFTKRVVERTYSVTVQKNYSLTWTDAKDDTKTITETVPVTQTISVKRACAYWEITQFNYYTLDRAVIYNKALPGGSCTMYPDYRHYSPPSVSINHRGNENNHIIDPPQTASGFIIMLAPEELSEEGVKPTIPAQDFTYEANTMTEEIKVINDYLSFGGAVVLDGGTYTKEAPSLTNMMALNDDVGLSGRDVFYRPDQVIEATLLNDVYPSSGTLIYKNHPSAVNSMGGSKSFQIQGLNSVTVHTPVICDASITTANTATDITSNDPYVQVLDVDRDCVQLVLDPDSNLSDFTVDISNYGEHLYSSGYLTRDFAWGIRDNTVSYIAKYNNIYRNEVKFPFDVFYRNSSGKDEYITKNTWMRFGHSTPTFYLPMWVDEGIYTVDFRTVAVNGVNTEDQLSKTQVYANINRSNYVATDTVRVQVSGRIYGLTLYDVTDYPTWETVFRVKTDSARLKLNEGYPSGIKSAKYNEGYAYDYAVGLNDQYGNVTGRCERFTIPLVNGSHPKIDNVGVLKTGYAVKFKVNTIGNAFSSGDSVIIKPRFYFVDAKGKNRREVDVYYNEYFNNKSHTLVKVGSSLDQTNIKKYRCGDQYLAIPDKQLKMMADIKKIDVGKYGWQKGDLFTYATIRMGSPLMTYVNTDYLLNLKAGDQYEKIQSAGITDTDIVNRMQTYYAEYFLPAEIKIVEKGFDVYGYAAKYGVSSHESFWLTGGYLIINFDIYTTRGSSKNLSYLNIANASNGYCSMWDMEGAVSGKVSDNGRRDPSTIFEFEKGDFMVCHSNKSVRDDYVTYIIN